MQKKEFSKLIIFTIILCSKTSCQEQTENVQFSNFEQPLETHASILVDNPIDYFLTIQWKTAKFKMPARSIQTIIL